MRFTLVKLARVFAQYSSFLRSARLLLGLLLCLLRLLFSFSRCVKVWNVTLRIHLAIRKCPNLPAVPHKIGPVHFVVNVGILQSIGVPFCSEAIHYWIMKVRYTALFAE